MKICFPLLKQERYSIWKRHLIIFFQCIFIFEINSFAIAANYEKNWQHGKVFRDCTICPELVVIKPGTFLMGSNYGNAKNGPAHWVSIKQPFAIGRFEVTFKEWTSCVSSGSCLHRPDDHNWGEIKRPVINVTWNQAQTYLRWLSKFTGHIYRLPSEAEWEYIDRAGTNTLFWWGNEVGVNNANCRDCGSNWSGKSSAPVGSFQGNPFGLFDTTGNVFEWVQDCWNPSHKGSLVNGLPREAGNCGFRVIRGGSFYYFSKVSQASYRAKNPPQINSYWLGFRVLRELSIE